MKRFEVFLKPSALKDLQTIDRPFQELIKERIRSLGENPVPRDAKKLLGLLGLFRVRKGKYRIVYSIDFKTGIVRVLAVDHRKDIYKRIDRQ